MKKLNMDDYLFHGIKPYKWKHFEEREQEEAEILRQILNDGFIGSRKYLREILSKEDYESLRKFKRTNWNGIDYVSITPYLSKILKDYYWLDSTDDEIAYNDYIRKYPSIILDSKLLTELSRNLHCYNTQPGEIQIKDKIPVDYFVGIMIPYIDLNSRFDRILTSSYHSSDCGLPSWYDTAKQDLLELTTEKFVNKYYQVVILFERVLQETNFHLNLYHTETGRPILSSSEEMKFVEKVKIKYL